VTEREVGLWLLVIGAVFALHCSRATIKEFRAGRALGGWRFGDWDRDKNTGAFWFLIVANALAALMGFAFVGLGILALSGSTGWIK